MKRSATWTRPLLVGLVALAATVVMTPSADAGQFWGHVRYKESNRDWRWSHEERGPVIVRESSAGPALAGLVGGFLLGQAFGHGHVEHYDRVVVRDCPPPPRYRYYDPCADTYYRSLDDCDFDPRDHRHPRFVRVIEISSGRCVGAMQWIDGDWRECSDRDGSRGWDRSGRYGQNNDEGDGR